LAKEARGAAYIAAQNAAQYLVSFLFYMGVARLLPQDDIGKLSLLLFYSNLLTTVTQLGLPAAATKFISESMGRGDAERASASWRNSLRLTLLSSSATLAGAAILSPLTSKIIFGGSQDAVPVALASAFASASNLLTLYGAAMLGLGMFAEMVSMSLVNILLGRALGLVAAWLGYGMTGVMSAWLAAALLSLALGANLVRGLPPSGGGASAAELLAYSYPAVSQKERLKMGSSGAPGDQRW